MVLLGLMFVVMMAVYKKHLLFLVFALVVVFQFRYFLVFLLVSRFLELRSRMRSVVLGRDYYIKALGRLCYNV